MDYKGIVKRVAASYFGKDESSFKEKELRDFIKGMNINDKNESGTEVWFNNYFDKIETTISLWSDRAKTIDEAIAITKRRLAMLEQAKKNYAKVVQKKKQLGL